MMRPSLIPNQQRQGGAALLLAMFIIGLAVTAYVIRSYDAAEMKARQDERTTKALAEAKEALIAWSVAHPKWPGIMPFPDRADDAEGYDGKSDCPPASAVNFSNNLLIGQLPLYGQTTPCVAPHIGIGGDWKEGTNNKLWYAVSRNLVRTGISSNLPVINPGMLTAIGTTSPYDGTAATQPYPWIKVVDGSGQVISDRVAAVLIAPGGTVVSQTRSQSAPALSEFLEGVDIANQTVVQRGQSSTFNDRLVYITIDELMVALAQRVVREVRHADFPDNGVIKRCVLNNTCQDIDATLSWRMRGVYVSEGQPPSSNQSGKQFRCKRELTGTGLQCSDEAVAGEAGENAKTLSLTIPLDSAYLGLTMSTQSDEKIRTTQGLIEVRDKDNKIVGRIRPASSEGMLEVFNSSNQPSEAVQAGWQEWFFQNNWGAYTDIVMSPAMRQDKSCDGDCFIMHRKNTLIENNIKLLILVKREGVGDLLMPDVYESNPKFLAMYWSQ